MFSGKRFLVGGKNISLLLNKLNLKKIPFYDLEEYKDKIYITIPKKHIKNFIALIDKMWYYKSVKLVGVISNLTKLKTNIGIFIGIIVFLFSTVLLNNVLLKVNIQADSTLISGIQQVLNSNNIKKYTWFSKIDTNLLQEEIYAQNPLICYSSVYKRGNTLFVKAEKSTTFTSEIDTTKTSLTSTCDGEILSLNVLRGYPLKSVGDTVKKGEVIVSGEKVEDGKEYKTFVLAKAKILCTYTYTAKEKESFALTKAKLKCGQEEYVLEEVTKKEDLVVVTLKYIIIIGE